jgi:hypothetical protein
MNAKRCEEFDMLRRMPTIFFGHGNPINSLLTTGWSGVLRIFRDVSVHRGGEHYHGVGNFLFA